MAGDAESSEPKSSSAEPPNTALLPLSPATTATRRNRGRPSGSKNKPKQPIIIARESPSSLRAHAMEVAPGRDISECIVGFCRRLQRGVSVLSGSGCVANVTLRHASTTSTGGAGIVTFHGRFEILSLLGSFLPPPSSVKGLTVFLSGAQGQVVGGAVVGALVAAGPVVVMAASFANASFDRLPAAGDDKEGGGHGCIIAHHKEQRGMVDRRSVQFEAAGGFCGVLPSVIAGGRLPPEFCTWSPAGRQLARS